VIPVSVVEITDNRLPSIRNGCKIFTTLEGENPGGSIKDRMVYGELSELIKKGILKSGQTIAEMSAGSTAKSLAHYCQKFDIKCVLFVPDTMDPKNLDHLRKLAEIHPVNVKNAFEAYEKFILKSGIRKFDQFGNKSLRRHYHFLGTELKIQCSPSAIIGAVGTGHSLAGASEIFQDQIPVYTAEPCEIGKIPGIRNLRLESFGDKDPCDPSKLKRIEVEERDYFKDKKLETNRGIIEISDSFRVVLGAVEKLNLNHGLISVVALGSNNRRFS
jgi:cysteine synthase